MSRRKSSALCGVVALIVAMLPLATARAQTTYDVVVGENYFKGGVHAMFHRYYPEALKVHQGDTLHFTADGFHSVTLLPAGEGPKEWRLANASSRSDPWAFLQSDPDDGARAVKINGAFFRSTNPECGSAEAPCVHDGSQLLNSGVAGGPLDYVVRVDAPPGTVLYAISLLHAEMDLRVEVVGEGDAASDPAELQQRFTHMLRRDIDSAVALHKKFNAKDTKHRDRQTKRVYWDAWAGVDSKHVSLLGMYPKKLRVRRGQAVRWHFDTLDNELHNVAMPLGKANEILTNTFQPACDPDGDTGAGPDNPQDLGAPPYCSVTEQTEVDLDNREANDVGNGVFTGSGDLETSGIRGSDNAEGRDPFGEAPYNVRFKAARKGYRYLCTVHGPIMSGRVIVR
jgi:plastocyanin